MRKTIVTNFEIFTLAFPITKCLYMIDTSFIALSDQSHSLKLNYRRLK